MRTGHAEPLARREAALALFPARRLLDDVEAFGQAVGVDPQIVGDVAHLGNQVGATHRERIEAELNRHFVQCVFERVAHIDRAVPAERTAGRRVGQDTLAVITHVLQVIDRKQHRARIQDRHDAVAGMPAAALDGPAVDGGNLAILRHSHADRDRLFGPSPVGDERVFTADHGSHRTPYAPRQHGGDQLDIERLGPRAEPAAEKRLDHANFGFRHFQDLR